MYNWLKHILLIVFLSNMPFSVFAQNDTERKLAQVPFKFYKASSLKTTISEIIADEISYSDANSDSGKIEAGDIFWVRADLYSFKDTLKFERWFLKTGIHMQITAFTREGEKIAKSEYGYLRESQPFQPQAYMDGIFFTAENLMDSRYLYFKMKFFNSKSHIQNLTLTLEPAAAHIFNEAHFTQSEFKKESQVYLFVGAFLFVFVFAFITYFTSRRLDFLFYSLYILCLLIYLGKSAFGINDLLVREVPLFSMWLHSVLQIFINLFYVIFAKHYLETRRSYSFLNKAIYGIAIFLIVLIIVETFLSITHRFEAHLALMNIHRLIMSVFAVWSFIYLLKYAKNTLAYFIIIGSFAFLVGSLAMLFTMDKTYMILGSVLEVLLFGLGLNYKMKKSNEEKILLKQSAYDNQISALRAQMNPHFIFNSLSSIQHLISSNKKEAAIKYLSKFSLLMRNVLESSIEANAVLNEEILLLRKYIELEALRFDHSFSYTITLDENIDPAAIEIPTFIIQPFVENAILHGLLNKESGDKKLRIHFRKELTYLICEVEDNGVGRKIPSKNIPTLVKQKISRGITVTEKRLQIIDESPETKVEIIDKIDEKGMSTGTLVVIKIRIE